jgi:hypothetical protein
MPIKLELRRQPSVTCTTRIRVHTRHWPRRALCSVFPSWLTSPGVPSPWNSAKQLSCGSPTVGRLWKTRLTRVFNVRSSMIGLGKPRISSVGATIRLETAGNATDSTKAKGHEKLSAGMYALLSWPSSVRHLDRCKAGGTRCSCQVCSHPNPSRKTKRPGKTAMAMFELGQMDNRDFKYVAAWLPRPLRRGRPRLVDDVAVDAVFAFAMKYELEPLCFSPGFDVIHSRRASEYYRQLAMTSGEDRFVQPDPGSPRRAVLGFIDSQVTLDLAEEWADDGALVAVPVGQFDLAKWAYRHQALSLLG